MYSRIMVAVDGSDCSTRALDESVRLALALGSTLCILHVADESALAPQHGLDIGAYVDTGALKERIRDDAARLLDAAVAAAAAAGCRAERRLVESSSRRVAEVLVHEAQEWRADLVVVGTHGRRGFERMLVGSVAENLVRVATTSLMLVRSEAASHPRE